MNRTFINVYIIFLLGGMFNKKKDKITLTKEEANRLFSTGEVEITWANTSLPIKIVLGE